MKSDKKLEGKVNMNVSARGSLNIFFTPPDAKSYDGLESNSLILDEINHWKHIDVNSRTTSGLYKYFTPKNDNDVE